MRVLAVRVPEIQKFLGALRGCRQGGRSDMTGSAKEFPDEVRMSWMYFMLVSMLFVQVALGIRNHQIPPRLSFLRRS